MGCLSFILELIVEGMIEGGKYALFLIYNQVDYW